mmetsp:Transcript_68605/g.121181  ORF Transcript_68605/g.121181 Transcript_68605/m.121181 type:complete len:239 (+) Transcript_68605:549-1265(+)
MEQGSHLLHSPQSLTVQSSVHSLVSLSGPLHVLPPPCFGVATILFLFFRRFSSWASSGQADQSLQTLHSQSTQMLLQLSCSNVSEQLRSFSSPTSVSRTLDCLPAQNGLHVDHSDHSLYLHKLLSIGLSIVLLFLQGFTSLASSSMRASLLKNPSGWADDSSSSRCSAASALLAVSSTSSGDMKKSQDGSIHDSYSPWNQLIFKPFLAPFWRSHTASGPLSPFLAVASILKAFLYSGR